MNRPKPNGTFPREKHRILRLDAARDALQEVVEEVGSYAWNYANVPVGDWVILHEKVSEDDPWFYPWIDMNALARLRN